MKGEFKKCCHRGNPIFQAPVCILAWSCKTDRKRGGKPERQEMWMSVQSASSGNRNCRHKKAESNVRDGLWDMQRGKGRDGAY